MITIQKLAKIFQKEFCAPFLPKGMVKAEIQMGEDKKPYLALTIGRRDVDIHEDGSIRGSGTFVGDDAEEE